MPPLRNLIGVDIGGTKIAVAAVAPSGRILARTSFPTEAASGFLNAVDRLSAAILQVDNEAGGADTPRQAGIGIGCAGPVDPVRGLINNPYTLAGWNQCDIITPLRERFGVDVRLENDADAAALGECWTGAGRGAHPVVMLTFGTGVGGGTVLPSGILRGAGGEHPELGHVPVDPDGPPCYCGIRGCLESVASGTAIGEAGKPLGFRDARGVFAAARSGDAGASAIVQRAIRAACTAAWVCCHTLLPRRLILGGGLMETEFDTFAGPMRTHLDQATQFTPSGVELVRAQLANDAGLVGAAFLVAAT